MLEIEIKDDVQTILAKAELKRFGRGKDSMALQVPKELVELIDEKRVKKEAVIKYVLTDKSVQIIYEFEREIELEGE